MSFLCSQQLYPWQMFTRVSGVAGPADHDYDNDNHSNQCNPNNDEYRGH
jgi:hypothetical protein